MTVSLKSNFFSNARGLTFEDSATVTWSFNANSNQLTATGSGGGGGSSANPSATIGLSAVNGTASTFMTSDSAPPLSQAIAPTWTGAHKFNSTVTVVGSGNGNGLIFTGSSAFINASGGTGLTIDAAASLTLTFGDNLTFIYGGTSVWQMASGAITQQSASGQISYTVYGAANEWTEYVIGSSTTSESFGLQIQAGTNSSDKPLNIINYANSATLLSLYGNGGMVLGAPSAGGNEGAGTINAQGLYVNGAAVSTAAGANPPASVGLSAVNGSSTNFMRADGAPALSQAIAPTWTGQHNFSYTSGSCAIFNPGAGYAGAEVISASASAPAMFLFSANSVLAELGLDGGQTLYSGSTNGDFVLRTVGATNNIWFVTDSTALAGKIAANGGLVWGAATGGSEGGGTVNVSGGYYVNGVQTNAPGGASTVTTLVQSGGASQNYTIPTNANFLRVFAIGGGGGGGSGGKNTSGTATGGGGAGGGGGISWADFRAADLGGGGTVVTCTFSSTTGGAGGASMATNAHAGNAGTAGANAAFGVYLLAAGGNGGTGGLAAGGAASGGTGGMGNWSQGTTGGAGETGAGGAGTAQGTSTLAVTAMANTGGGGGSGLTASPTTAAGGAGGGGSTFQTLTGGAAGTNPGGTGGNGANGGASIGAAGGGGGSGSATTNGGPGGNGGNYGGGGGGGGGALNTFGNSGAGGNGGPAAIIIISW
jgi:hypothetical protein